MNTSKDLKYFCKHVSKLMKNPSRLLAVAVKSGVATPKGTLSKEYK